MTDAQLTTLALAYYDAVEAQRNAQSGSDYYQGLAYLRLSSAADALRAIAKTAEADEIDDIASYLSDAYERNRNRQRELAEAVRTTRMALGYSRSLARELFGLVDDINCDDTAGMTMAVKVKAVAEMIDGEE